MSWSDQLAQVQGASPAIVGILVVVISILIAAAFVGVVVGGLSRSSDDE